MLRSFLASRFFASRGRDLVRTGAGILITGWLAPLAFANSVPVATGGNATVEPGGEVTIMLAGSDSDGDLLDRIITALPTKGSVSAGLPAVTLTAAALPYTVPNHGSTVRYTAAEDDHGDQTITFKLHDGTGESQAATVTIRVNRAPLATAGETFFTTPSTELKLTLPALDPDGDTLNYTITSLPGHGRLKDGTTVLADTALPFSTAKNTLTYTPDPTYRGPDGFTFDASDGYGSTGSVAVSLHVNTTPVASAISTTVLPSGLREITLTGVDADRDAVRYAIVSLPSHGSLSVAGVRLIESKLPAILDEGQAQVAYAVNPGHRGVDTFHFRVHDLVSQSERAVVTIAVNTPPVVKDLTFATPGGTTTEAVLLPSDADGDSLTVRITRLPAGTLKLGGKAATKTDTVYPVPASGLAFSWTAAGGAALSDWFEWEAGDGRDVSNVARVTFVLPGTSTNSGNPPPSTQPAGDQPEPEPDASDSQGGAACGRIAPGEAILGAWITAWLGFTGRGRRLRAARRF